LHDAVEALKAGRGTLAEMAAALGYADQAHFTHETRDLSGLTPAQLRSALARSMSVLDKTPAA
jgi:AraC-like DNA-binding protein